MDKLIRVSRQIYSTLEEELDSNKTSLEFLDDVFQDIYKATIDIDRNKYYEDFKKTNKHLLLYRNFLLIFFFMKIFHKENVLRIDEKRRNKKHLDKLETFVHKTVGDIPKKVSVEMLYQLLFANEKTTLRRGSISTLPGVDIKQKFNEFLKIVFTDIIALNTVDMNLQIISGIPCENITKNKFIKNWTELLTNKVVDKEATEQRRRKKLDKRGEEKSIYKHSLRSDEQVMDIFLGAINSDFRKIGIPQSLKTFLRYYIYNDTFQSENKNRSVYISGVGTQSLTSMLMIDAQKPYSFARELQIGIDDANEISEQLIKIRYRMITDKDSVFENIQYSNLINTEFNDKSFDVVVSIPPEQLTQNETDKFIHLGDENYLEHQVQRYENYNPLPTQDLSSFIHYYNALKIAKKKVLMIVPLRFISFLDYTSNIRRKNDNNENGSNDVWYAQRGKFNENQIFSERLKEIIEEQHIKKVMLLPKDMFFHTKQQCVLLEISPNNVKGVQFIDGTQYTRIDKQKRIIIQNTPTVKKIFDTYGEDYIHNKLVSKYVTYKDIIDSYNFNMKPLYHLHIPTVETEKEVRISDLFDVIKVQSFRPIANGVKTEVYSLKKSFFNITGISTTEDMDKVEVLMKKKQKFFVQDSDIVIDSRYKDKSDIAYISLKRKNDICIPTHNLIIIRHKDNIDNAKKLFLFLMSKDGNSLLQGLATPSNDNRNILSIESLENLEFPIENFDTKQFLEVQKQSTRVRNSLKKLNKLFE